MKYDSTTRGLTLSIILSQIYLNFGTISVINLNTVCTQYAHPSTLSERGHRLWLFFQLTQFDAIVILQVFMQAGYLFRDGVEQSAVEIHKSCVPTYGRGSFLQLSTEI